MIGRVIILVLIFIFPGIQKIKSQQMSVMWVLEFSHQTELEFADSTNWEFAIRGTPKLYSYLIDKCKLLIGDSRLEITEIDISNPNVDTAITAALKRNKMNWNDCSCMCEIPAIDGVNRPSFMIDTKFNFLPSTNSYMINSVLYNCKNPCITHQVIKCNINLKSDPEFESLQQMANDIANKICADYKFEEINIRYMFQVNFPDSLIIAKKEELVGLKDWIIDEFLNSTEDNCNYRFNRTSVNSKDSANVLVNISINKTPAENIFDIIVRMSLTNEGDNTKYERVQKSVNFLTNKDNDIKALKNKVSAMFQNLITYF